MVLVDVDVTAGGDDGHVYRFGYSINATGFTITGQYLDPADPNTITANTSQSRIISGTNNKTQKTDSRGFFLFKGITIPQGSTIDDATLNLVGQTSNGGDVRVYGRLTASPTTPTGTTGTTIFTKPLGTAFGTTTFASGTDAPVAIDMKSTIQELVNTFDYNNDNMMLIMKANPNTLPTTPVSTGVSNSISVRPFEFGGAIPNLTINYSETCNADLCEKFDTYAISKLPTFREKFNYSTQALADASWVSSDTALIRVDPINEKLDFDWTNHNVSDRIYHDLGSVQSETDWTLRCKATFSSVGVVTINAYPIGLYDTNAQDSGVVQDGVGIFMSDVIALRFYDNSNLLGGTASTALTAPTVGVPVFWEIKRIGGDTVRLTQYSDSDYSVIIDSADVTGVPSTLNGLQFIKCLQRNDFTAGQITGTIEDVEFWNEGQQGDRTFQDDFVLKPVTFSDDFLGGDNWVDAGTAIGVNIATNVIDWDVNDTSINHATAFDLGVNGINDNSWALRAKVTINNVVAGASADTNRLYFGLFDSDQSVDSNTVQDGLFIGFLRGNTSNEIGLFHRDGAVPDGNSDVIFTTTITATTFFVEVKRTSATSVAVSLFSDSSYTTLIETQTTTIPSTISTLRYIKAQNRSTLTGDSTLDGTIDDVEIYNGTSTLTDWTGTGTKVVLNTSTQEVDWDADRDTLNHAISHDLQSSIGGNASDDNWTLRFKYLTNNITNPTGSEPDLLYITLSQSDDSASSSTVQEHVSIAFQAESSPGVRKTFIEAGTGSLHTAVDAVFADQLWSAGTEVFVELKRTSVTSYEASLFSDANYRNLIERITSTSVDATVNALRYIKIQTRTDTATDGVFNGIIDDIEFYNGVAVPRTPISETPKLFEDRVDTDKGWVTTDATAMAVNLSTQVLDINVLRDSSQDAIAFDLGAGVLSETRWGLRFKYDITAIDPANTGTKRIVCGLFDTNQVASIASAQDGIMIMFNLATDTTLVRANATDGTNPQSGGFFKEFINVITEVKTYYIEIIRISATSYSVEVFSDPDYQISLEKQTLDTISSGISGLRYIKFLGDETSGPVTGSFTGTIDDIELWNDKAPLDHRNKWRVLNL